MPNIPVARDLCEEFIKEMTDNRKGFDDAGVARGIVTDLDRYGRVMPAYERKLSHWCHTDGNTFKRGMPIAQNISIALYDRIIPRQD
jgi:hypothetical protein